MHIQRTSASVLRSSSLIEEWTFLHVRAHACACFGKPCSQWCTVPTPVSYFLEASRHARSAPRRRRGSRLAWRCAQLVGELPSERSRASVRGSLVKPVSSRHDRHLAFPVWWWLRVVQTAVVKTVSLFSSSIRSVMQKYLAERNEITFDKIFNQKIGKSCLFT